LDEHALLAVDSVIDAALKDAATVTMGADAQAVTGNFIEDKIGVLRLKVIETFLNDVITVQILDETDDVGGQRVLDGLDLIAINRRIVSRRASSTNLLARRNELDHLLKGTGAMLIQGDLDHMGSSVIDENCALVVVAIF
jgi:hypothetical protein